MRKRDDKTLGLIENKLIDNSFVIEVEVITEHQYKNIDTNQPKKSQREYEPYTKVFKSVELRLEKAKLSAEANQLLTWMQDKSVYGIDYVYLNKKAFMYEHGQGDNDNPFYRARTELIDKQFIYKTGKKHTYKFHPRLFFTGDRAKAFKDNVKLINKTNQQHGI